jgi:hypothetical protein
VALVHLERERTTSLDVAQSQTGPSVSRQDVQELQDSTYQSIAGAVEWLGGQWLVDQYSTYQHTYLLPDYRVDGHADGRGGHGHCTPLLILGKGQPTPAARPCRRVQAGWATRGG